MERTDLPLGGRLAYCRKAARMTQREVASAVGYSENSIANWEAGRAVPSQALIDELADLYGVPRPWLRAGEVAPVGSQDALPELPGPPPAFDGEDVSSRFVRCPACGAGGLRVREVPAHLAGGECVRRHTRAEAAALLPTAQTDPDPWLAEMRACEKAIAKTRADAKRARGPARRGLMAAATLIELQLEKLAKLGPDRFRRSD